MSHTYKNIIFTTHAYERIISRSLAVHSIYETINFPEKVLKESQGNKKFIKIIQKRKYQVVATYKQDQNKYLVISAWVRGEEDKQPLAWQLITLPFKLIWWLLTWILKKVWHLVTGKKS